MLDVAPPNTYRGQGVTRDIFEELSLLHADQRTFHENTGSMCTIST